MELSSNIVRQQVDNNMHVLATTIRDVIQEYAVKGLAVLQIGIVLFIIFYCIQYMFSGEQKISQKIVFSYFLLFLARIFGVLIIR